MSFFFFFLLQVLSREGEYWWEEGDGGERVKEGEYGAHTVYTCMQM
jgi:hypothetical protein